jgi:uncharacterized protein (TIGR02118 family)
MKSICLLSQKPGSSRTQFRDYYEATHAPLAAQHFPFRKYVRNHVLDADDAIDFDVVSEFYVDDFALTANVLAGPAGAIFDADEKRFMNQALVRPAMAQETLAYGPPRDVVRSPERRWLLMLTGDGANQAALDWGRAIGEECGQIRRVTLDWATSFSTDERRFPFAGMLSLWLMEGATLKRNFRETPDRLVVHVAVLTEVCETPPEQLQ